MGVGVEGSVPPAQAQRTPGMTRNWGLSFLICQMKIIMKALSPSFRDTELPQDTRR